MSQLQYIFNPVSKKKSSKRSVKVAKSKKSKAKKSGAKSRRTRKNPVRDVVAAYKKGSKKTKKNLVQKKTGKMRNTVGETKAVEYAAAKTKDKLNLLKRGKKNKKARKQLRKALSRQKAILKKIKARNASSAKETSTLVHDAQTAGFETKVSKQYFKVAGGKVAKRKKAKKKKVGGRKKISKKTSKKASKKKSYKRKKKSVVAKIAKKAKRSTGRKKSAKRSKASKRSVGLSKKFRKVTFKGKMRLNPIGGGMGKGISVKGYAITGYDVMEIGALGIGGAVYGALNAALPKIPFIGQLQATLQRVPVVGTALAPMFAGIAINALAGKFIKNPKMQQYASMIGDGLVGAAVVGMGVNASQYVPFLNPQAALSGVDFTPEMSGVDFTAQMNGVDYTPQMNGVDFTAEMSGPDFGGVDFTSDMSGIPDGMGSADFGDYEQSESDFGAIPDGIG